MRKRNLIMAAGACLAVMSMIAPSALADPTDPTVPPGPARILNGVGSDTTQDVTNALSDVLLDGSGNKRVASWNASGTPDPFNTGVGAACNYTRTETSGSGNGVRRLREALTPGDARFGCVNFDRSSSNSASTIPSTGPRLSLVPFATDGLTYGIRSDGGVFNNFSQAELQEIYNCQGPALDPDGAGPLLADVFPLLPQFGSGTRSSFVSQILVIPGGDRVGLVNEPGRTCIRDALNGRPLLENTGILLTDRRHLAPYSVAQYNAQINRVIPDVHGRVVLGLINDVAPNVVNAAHVPAGITYTVRDDSGVFLDLSAQELGDIYRDNGTPGAADCNGNRPLLPPPGAQRTAFLNALVPPVVTPGSCVTQVAQENNGVQALTLAGQNQIYPYSIDTYNRQVNRVIADVHGRAVLGSIGATSPNVLNTTQLGTRTVYHVIPTGHETGTDAVSIASRAVFVGSGSGSVCSRSDVITRQGFAGVRAPETCGVITDRRGT